MHILSGKSKLTMHRQINKSRAREMCVCVFVRVCVCRGGRGEHERNDPSRWGGGGVGASLKKYFSFKMSVKAILMHFEVIFF